MNNFILGGGIAGLAAYNRLKKHGITANILERNCTLGGLTRSIYVDRFVFDYTGHFLHLASLKHPDELGLLSTGKWKKISRKAFCYSHGVFIEAPFQYNLAKLPKSIRNECLNSFLEVSSKPQKTVSKNYHLLDYFLDNFGSGITNHFLKPYNEKILATDLTSISASSINRFFPLPKKDLIEKGASLFNQTSVNLGYNSEFWYPEENGIQQLINNMAHSHSCIPEEVKNIDLEKRIITTNKSDYKYNNIFSSIPLDQVLRMSKHSTYQNNETSLSYASVRTYQIGIRCKLPDDLKDKHWIYIADPTIPFHRVGIYSNFNHTMSPSDCYNLYVEVGIHCNTPQQTINIIDNDVINSLENLGWVKKENIEILISHTIEHGYVHFNHEWINVVPKHLSFLDNHNFHCIGRYGCWDYIGMEDGVINAWNTVDKYN
ncbi:MAG: NAD(P)-binding protein [Pseudomonadota bacterium]